MKMKTILSGSIKPTILTVAIAIVLSVVFAFVIVYLDRVAWSENQTAPSTYFYFSKNSPALAFVYRFVSDLSVIARYVAELGFILLIAQLTYRLFNRKKKS